MEPSALPTPGSRRNIRAIDELQVFHAHDFDTSNTATMQECCVTGFRWEGAPVGKETTIGDLQAYVTGDNKERAILFNHDALGWQWNNNRLLADHFAKEVGATVYMPDLCVFCALQSLRSAR